MMKDYKRFMKRHENGYIEPICKNCPYDDKCDVGTHYCFQAIKEKLAEVEDKIENGTLVEFPRIIHPNRMEWYVQYQYPNGVVQYYICFSQPEAEAKLRELKGDKNEQSTMESNI